MKKLRAIAALLLATLLALSACSSGGSKSVEKAAFSDAESGVAFEYPSNWVQEESALDMTGALQNICMLHDEKEEEATFDMEILNVGDGFVVPGRNEEDVKALADQMFTDMSGAIDIMTADLEDQGVTVKSVEASEGPEVVQLGGKTFYQVEIKVAVSAGLSGDEATFKYALGYANDRLFYLMVGAYGDQGATDMAALLQSLRFDAAE